jgi:hypothetical protein
VCGVVVLCARRVGRPAGGGAAVKRWIRQQETPRSARADSPLRGHLSLSRFELLN